MSSNVELFVALPYEKWKSMEKWSRDRPNVKTDVAPDVTPDVSSPDISDTKGAEVTTEPSESDESSKVNVEEKHREIEVKNDKVRSSLGKDVSKTYRANQIVKLLQRLRSKGYKELDKIDNLESLVKNSLGNSAKVLPNEKVFYDLIFKTNLAPYVRNRHKIQRYYKRLWYQI